MNGMIESQTVYTSRLAVTHTQRHGGKHVRAIADHPRLARGLSWFPLRPLILIPKRHRPRASGESTIEVPDGETVFPPQFIPNIERAGGGVSEVSSLLASLTLRPNTQHPIKSLAFHEA